VKKIVIVKEYATGVLKVVATHAGDMTREELLELIKKHYKTLKFGFFWIVVVDGRQIIMNFYYDYPTNTKQLEECDRVLTNWQIEKWHKILEMAKDAI